MAGTQVVRFGIVSPQFSIDFRLNGTWRQEGSQLIRTLMGCECADLSSRVGQFCRLSRERLNPIWPGWLGCWHRNSPRQMATSRSNRSSVVPFHMPNLPTFAEAGFPNFHSATWVGFFVSANDFSQLPVMQGEREVKGMVTWKSIG